MSSQATADFLVVGGGSAGCVLAGTLAAAGAEVVLLEAGQDTPPGHVPADILDLFPRSSANPAYFWPGLTVDAGWGRTVFLAAKVLGGGSSVNGMFNQRGRPDDYEGWVDGGATGWSWAEVEPFFERVESVFSLVRRGREQWPPFATAIAAAAERRGLPELADMNTEFGDGHMPVPTASTTAGRVTSSSAFLDTVARARPNLRIEAGTRVERLRFEGTRCVGVTAVKDGERRSYGARHVVLAAGGIHSPAILLRSGIGDPSRLELLGIDVVAALPGVGRNLQNHPAVYLAAYLRRDSRQPRALRPAVLTTVRSSSDPGDPARHGDTALFVIGKTSFRGVGEATAAIGVCLWGPDSVGDLSLSSADSDVLPDVRFAMLTDPGDVARMATGLALAHDLMRDEAVASVRHEMFVAENSSLVRRLNGPGTRAAVLSVSARVALDTAGPVRRRLIAGSDSSATPQDRAPDRGWLEEVVRNRSSVTYHPTGSCRMGPASSSDAVVGPDARVHGIDGLSVADASIMPRIVRANPNLPTMMIGARVAAFLLAGR